MNTKKYANLGATHFKQGKFAKALVFLQRAHQAEPRNMGIMHMMANCYFKLGDQDNGIKTIEQVLEIDTKNHRLSFQLGLAHLQNSNIEAAIGVFNRAIELYPREINYFIHLADLYEKTNQHDKALEIICQGLIHFPNSDPLQILAAKSEKQMGKNKESLVRLESLGSRETSLPPYWRIQYNFELGHIHDRNNNADSAFHHFTRGNEIIRTSPPYQQVDKGHSLNLIKGLGKLDFGKINRIIDLSKNNPPPIQPVFFVGFPRSGTTLLQKVLDNHRDVHVIEENNPLGRVTSLIERETEKYLGGDFLLNEKNIDSLRKIYFDEARKYVPIDDGCLIVDKLPMNIVQVHIIKILFPDAKILLGLRHPCDSILSCFMQNFAVNRAMASMFKFDSVINYYDNTMGLWKIFKRNIEFESYAVRYEDLIENMEGEVRELLQFLNLQWDEETLNYRQNAFKRGLINTPSYSQVVKPIYKEARYRWHRYAKYFEPYFENLRPHCDEFGYSLQIDNPREAENTNQ